MRRARLLGAVLALSVLAAVPATARVGDFRFGVAAGDVTHNRVKLWGATKGEGRVTAEVAKDKRFRNLAEHEGVRSNDARDNTVHVIIRRLQPDRRYFFRFCAKNECSDRGRFTTAPKASKGGAIEFAYTGDADGTSDPGEDRPFFGPFEVYRTMANERNDFNVNLGDTIYSDSGVGNRPPALTVKEKWAKYRQNLEQRNLRKLRGSAGFYSHWDDHEFFNDFSVPEDGQKLYKAGVKAFTDYAPVGFRSQAGLYRSFRWGQNAELFFLDERSFRDAKADFTGVCDNPQTGEPDLAPTAPQRIRDTFSVLIPSFAQPVSQDCKDAINDPNRTLLGRRQFNRFVDEVAASDARFKIIINETPIQQFYGLPYDRWEGYAYERVRLLNELQAANVQNLVFLTTDTHAALANVIRLRTFSDDVAPANAPAAPQDSPYQDFVIGPVGTNTFWAEIDDVTGSEGSGELLSQAFFKPPPPNGVGMSCAQGDVYSYGQVRVTGSRLIIQYKDRNGDPVLDVNGQPCGPYTIEAQ